MRLLFNHKRQNPEGVALLFYARHFYTSPPTPSPSGEGKEHPATIDEKRENPAPKG